MKVEVLVTKARTFEMKGDDLRQAVSEVFAKEPECEILTIDGREVVGVCDGCKIPLFGDDDYRASEGRIYCRECVRQGNSIGRVTDL